MVRYDDQDSLMMHRSGIGNRVNLIDKSCSNNDTLRPNMRLHLVLSKMSCVDLFSPYPSNSTFNKDFILSMQSEILNGLIMSTEH